jgi:hypothetical protein
MKKTAAALMIALMALPACSYGAMSSHEGKLYVARNDGFLFGALRKIYECTTDGKGNMVCVAIADKP